ncbi:MAG: GGDEF domain-containing protein [Oscillospiraceae bacterium]|jgi:diguanylate cyclase (GGDEF)-like protein|nr:GGDEF domain-containing protein [Oscillospiraceae bacterium]
MTETAFAEELRNEDEGERRIRQTKVFRVTLILCALVHTILCVIFFALRVHTMFIFNCFSVLLYIVLIIYIGRENFRNCMMVAYWEILLHSVFACLTLGWSSGFALYILAMMPVAFYVFYISSAADKRRKYEPYILGLVAVIAFFVIRIMSYERGTDYFAENELLGTERFIYLYNALVACGLLSISAMIFAREAQINQNALRKKNERLIYIASIDPLTGLLNRRSMKEYLASAHEAYEKTNHRYFIAIGDIDDFKQVNDTYGHDCGDEMILKVTETMTGRVGGSDQCARWGGEEFLILMRGIDEAQAYERVEDIRKCMGDTAFVYGEKKINITITFGLAAANENRTLGDVIIAADKCLYRGKTTGKNRVVLSA